MNRFIMLVGTSGSGKSTFANNLCDHEENYVLVSSDSVREELFGDESVQGDPSVIFEICKARCAEELKNGRDVILDATNLNRKKRKAFLNDVRNRSSVPFISECYVIAATYEDCLLRNSERARHVPEYVIQRQFSQFQMPLYSEGWDSIQVRCNSYITLEEMLNKCRGLEHDNEHHKLNVYDHLLETEYWILNHYSFSLDTSTCNLLSDLALWHDVGKAYTKVFTDKKGNPTQEAHFYCHECWSSLYCLCDVTYSQDYRIKLAQLVSLHMMKYQSEYERFIDKWAPEYKGLLSIFNTADAESA